MLLNNPFDKILGQASKIKILRFLINSQAQFNGREIAKNTGLSHVKVHAALKDLCRHGVINMRSAGNSLIYWLNEEHFLVKEVLRPIFEKEANLFETITKIILNKSRRPLPLSIILFGSFAKERALADSDIDIVMIYPGSKKHALITQELREAEKEITTSFGNHLAAIPVKIEEFKRRIKKKKDFMREVSKTGRVIYGKNIPELINYR